eukprot:Pgem_evm1s6989
MKFAVVLLGFTLFAQNSSASYYEEDKKECKVHTCDTWKSTCEKHGKIDNDKDWEKIHCRGKACVKKCCKKPPQTCSVWAVEDNCENHDLINKENIDFDKIHCKGENCVQKCCQEPECESTCEDWNGQCGVDQIEKPNQGDIECVGDECAKKCCKDKPPTTCEEWTDKPPTTCEEWTGQCGVDQIEKPNQGDIECVGDECAKKCCKDKPPTTCEEWTGQCGVDQIEKPNQGDIECVGDECAKKCCKDKPPTTCEEWTGQCGVDQIEKPNQGDIECVGGECTKKCCTDKPPTTCEDWTGSCPADHQNKPGFENIECPNYKCTVQTCCEKQTCETWDDDCEAHGLVDKNIDFDSVACQGPDDCKTKCCDKPIPVCDREKLKINGKTNPDTIHLDDNKGVSDLDIVSSFDGEVSLNVIQDQSNILLSECMVTVKDGKEETVFITPQRCHNKCKQHRSSVIELVYQLPEIDGSIATCKQSVNVKRVERKLGFCKSEGDPHTFTIDGGKHSWGGNDYVKVFESNDLRILGHHEELVVDYFKPEDKWGNEIPVASYYEAMFQYKNTAVSLLRRQTADPTYQVHDHHYCKDGHGVHYEKKENVNNHECKKLCDKNDSCFGYEIKKNHNFCQLSYGGKKPQLEYAPHYGSNDFQCVLKNLDEYTYEQAFDLKKKVVGNGPEETIGYDRKKTNEGYEHIFTLPEGSEIKFAAQKGLIEEGWLVNIFLNIAAKHRGNVVGGVCGDWDGNGANDSYDYSEQRRDFLVNTFWPSSYFGAKDDLVSVFPPNYEGKVCKAGVPEKNAITVADMINTVDKRRRRDVSEDEEAGVKMCQEIVDLKLFKEASSKNLFDAESLKDICMSDAHIGESKQHQNLWVANALREVREQLEQNTGSKLGKRSQGELDHDACNFPFGKFVGHKCRCSEGYSGNTCSSTDLKKKVQVLHLLNNQKCIDMSSPKGRAVVMQADLDVENQDVQFIIHGAGRVLGTSTSHA